MSLSRKTKVIFRKWKGANAMSLCRIIAIFPEEPGDLLGNYCMSFEHVGQHGAGCLETMMENTEPISVKDPEVRDLMDELRGRGYELEIVEDVTPEMSDIRSKKARNHP